MKPLKLYPTMTRNAAEAFDRIEGFVKKGLLQGPIAVDADGNECGSLNNSTCKVCLWGALDRSNLSAPLYHRIEKALTKIATSLTGGARTGYITYNETPGRKKSEVLNLVNLTRKMVVK